MLKFVIIVGLSFLCEFSFGQISPSVKRIYYYNSENFDFIDSFETDSTNCTDLEYFTRNVMVDSLKAKVNGWMLIKKRNYLIVRHMTNGIEDGLQFEYKERNKKYLLVEFAIYSNEKIVFSASFDSKKHDQGLISNLKSYQMWIASGVDPNLYSTKIKLKKNNSQKRTEYRFYSGSSLKGKTISKIHLNESMITCQVNHYDLEKYHRVVNIAEIEQTLLNY